MFDFLEKLRDKPEHYRHTIAFIFSFFVVSGIFGVWLSVKIPQTSEGIASVKQEVSDIATPISNFKRNAAQVFESLNNQYSEIKKSLRNTE